ncbi:MAG: HD domain-containing protein [Candidatus Bathyarchaeia archaeon]
MRLGQREQIEKYAKNQMAKLGLYAWPHVKRVERYCLLISKFEAENKSIDLEVLRTAALLHDIAKHLEKKKSSGNHGEIGAIMAHDFLKTIGVNEAKISLICHAIRVHTHREKPFSVEAKILHDADFLDKLGAVGIASVFIKACLTNTTIEEVAEMYDLETPKPSYVAKHVRWLKKQHFYTQTAEKMAKRRNEITSLFFKALKNELNSAGLRKRNKVIHSNCVKFYA